MSARMRWVLLSLVVCVTAASGCGGGGSQTFPSGSTSGGGDVTPIVTTDTTPPAVSAAVATPTVLSFTGGSVRVVVDASDSGSGLSQVWVDVVSPAGTSSRVALTASTTSGRYEGAVVIPPNSSSTGTPAVYSITAGAQDASQNTAAAGSATVTVQAALAPPAIPLPGP